MKKVDRSLLVIGLIFLASIILFSGFLIVLEAILNDREESRHTDFGTFGSCSSLARHINENNYYDYYPYPEFDGREEDSVDSSALPSEGAGQGGNKVDYSDTNIQVEGVNEADIIKTKGTELYVLNQTDLIIFDVTDPANPIELSRTEVSANPIEMFLYEDKVVVFGND